MENPKRKLPCPGTPGPSSSDQVSKAECLAVLPTVHKLESMLHPLLLTTAVLDFQSVACSPIRSCFAPLVWLFEYHIKNDVRHICMARSHLA